MNLTYKTQPEMGDSGRFVCSIEEYPTATATGSTPEEAQKNALKRAWDAVTRINEIYLERCKTDHWDQHCILMRDLDILKNREYNE